MIHKSLVQLGVRWLKYRCSIVFYEFTTSANETPDIIGWCAGQSILIECKASRADFLSDGKKLVRRYPELMGMGRQRYYLCPSGMINIADLPPRWGLLWAKGKRVFMQCGAGIFPDIDQQSEINFLVSMLRRTQVRLGKQALSEWLHYKNIYKSLM
jgi:hypothetical protein